MGFWEFLALLVFASGVFIYCAHHLGSKMDNMRNELHSLSKSFEIVAKETQENTQNIRRNIHLTTKTEKKVYKLASITRRVNSDVLRCMVDVVEIKNRLDMPYSNRQISVIDIEFDKFLE